MSVSAPTDAMRAGRSTDAPYPSLSRAGYVIAVLFVVTLMSQLDRQLPALMVRPLRAEFGISDTAFSLLQGYAFAISFTLAGLPLGQLADRHNRRNLICAGLLVWSAATALFAFGTSYNALLLARVGVGMGEAVLAPAACSLISDLVPVHQRGRALALYAVSIAIGSGASLGVGGWLLASMPAVGLKVPGLGDLAAWRIVFLAAAAPGLPLALLLLASVREPARQPGLLRPGAAGHRASFADLIAFVRLSPAAFARVLGYPAVLAVMGYGAVGWAPALFDRSHGIAPATSALWLGVIVAVAGTAGLLLGGWLSDRWLAQGKPAARLRVALVGLAVAALPAVSWSLVSNASLAFGLLFLTVAGIGLAQSAVPTSVQAIFPNRLRGQAIALYMLLAGLLGIGLGPTAVALVTDHLFHDEQALGHAIALTAAPAVLLGLWLVASGLKPYEALHARVEAVSARGPINSVV